MPSTPLESLLKRDRAIVLAGLAGLTLLAWAYLLYEARAMSGMAGGMGLNVGREMAMPQRQSWGLLDLFLLFVMWTVMMVGMMVPTAAPTVLLFARVNRIRQEQQRPFAHSGMFLLGYLVAWTLFSLVATLGQWQLHNAALLSPMMVSTSPILAGILLLAAGVFQWTPAKNACLTHCRSPHSFLASHWREGRWGGFVMGLSHGFSCVGCCWLLMGLLFVTGVMNLVWVAVIAGFVLMEKVAPPAYNPWINRGAGFLLFAWGAALLGRILL